LRIVELLVDICLLLFENKSNTKGERYVWLEPAVVARLRVLRGSGESHSDIILRVAAEGVERTK
jgi:hypothetical protein